MAGRAFPFSFRWWWQWDISTRWSAAALVSALLVLAGAWLPWTSTEVADVFVEARTIGAGVQPFDYHVVVPAVFAAVAVVLTWSVSEWRPDLLLLAAAKPIISLSTELALNTPSENITTELGGYATVIGGFFLAMLGLYSVVLRLRSKMREVRRSSWGRTENGVHASNSVAKLGSLRGWNAPSSLTEWIRANPSRGWTVAALLAAFVTLAAAFATWRSNAPLFWVQLDPATRFGLISAQRYVLVPALAAATAVVLTLPFPDWRPDIPLVFTAMPILYYSFRALPSFWSIDQMAREPGSYVLLGGGCLLAIVGHLGCPSD